MKKIFLISIAIILNLNTQAQYLSSETAILEMKYWKLRGRLIGDDNNKNVYNGSMTDRKSESRIEQIKRLHRYVD